MVAEEVPSSPRLLDHLQELARRARRVLLEVLAVLAIYFAVGITEVKVAGVKVPVPYPTIFQSLSSDFARFLLQTELPKGMTVITVSPFEPIYADLMISIFLAVFTLMPLILREVWGFVSPALYRHEKRLVRYSVLPSIALFAAGASFAYFVIIPAVLKFVMVYDVYLGVKPTIGLQAFVNFLVALMLGTGLAFEFPLVMSGLTYVGAVKSSTWKRNWRWGVVASFVIALIISPGTTGGLIETVIGATLTALYFVGVVASSAIEGRRSPLQ
ncbi:twin-arginine translocase subunit TatC [Sulfodiicoccus acidiphilus]|uniref:Sec-independent protein translocase protein TatC n=1 Tax=Sulfodiicoccus acidiphilus TaxID=1670455 RepID=A0A348B4G2_9CREN|nr:twin-arginine translocase subunit TatC [Sulfodiicoccus acidiphilus]BBD73064.1 twin-arginine translocase subunit TatC [Sulfodiicoccus acidiphilus]GGU03990.1 twin-arginine translocase subunit TatC [Sulfodiicoccus acidiphilus]